MDLTSKPLAAKGYISYRYKGRYGWIMIGAKNTLDALNEAKRSTSTPVTLNNLQIWSEEQYEAVAS